MSANFSSDGTVPTIEDGGKGRVIAVSVRHQSSAEGEIISGITETVKVLLYGRIILATALGV